VNPEKHRVAVAICPRPDNLKAIAGGFSFGPQSLASATVEGDEPCSQRRLQRLPVHEANHEQFRGSGVLNDCGSQALHFAEVDLHRKLLVVNPGVRPRAAETKNPLRVSRQRAWISYDCFRSSSEVLRRHAHRVVMVVMTMMVKRSHDKMMLSRFATVRQLLFV
jgi:hypothetical protein